MKKDLKLFVVRKYVIAESALEAIKNEKKKSVDDVWLDDDWKKQQEFPKKDVGFK